MAEKRFESQTFNGREQKGWACTSDKRATGAVLNLPDCDTRCHLHHKLKTTQTMFLKAETLKG